MVEMVSDMLRFEEKKNLIHGRYSPGTSGSP